MNPAESLQLSVENISQRAASLAPEQVATLAFSLEGANDPQWREKLTALIKGLKDKKQLEAAGRVLTLSQVLYLLENSKDSQNGIKEKLSPLFVGMPNRVFLHLVMSATASQMQFLKTEINTEPFLHQMTVATHEIGQQVKTAGEKLFDLEKTLEQLNFIDPERKNALDFICKITDLADEYQSIINKSNKLLALAWNSNRMDILEKLSAYKEQAERTLRQFIGMQRSKRTSATGLYKKIEQLLEKTFGQKDDAEALEDDEPAIEALAKFSIWYMKDYWELGLLPHIQTLEDLEKGSKTPDQRNILLQNVNDNLASIQLKTVKDLKERGIYSRKSLQEYIQGKSTS